jgi:hypothetical protein
MNNPIATLLILSSILTIGNLPASAQTSAPLEGLPQLAVQSNAITSIAETFIDRLSSGEFMEALQHYDAAVVGGVSSNSLMVTWQDIEATYGMLQQQVNTQVIPLENSSHSYVVIVTCEFEQGTRDILITLLGNQVIDFAVAL